VVSVLVGIASFIAVSFIITLCCSIRRKRRFVAEARRVAERRARRAQERLGREEENDPENAPQEGDHQRNQNQANVYLTQEELDKFLPGGKFKAFKSQFAQQSTCSICLEDFKAEDTCRQLYCEHIFHDKCIEAWLARHSNCPNCKKDITKEAIEGFYAAKTELAPVAQTSALSSNGKPDEEEKKDVRHTHTEHDRMVENKEEEKQNFSEMINKFQDDLEQIANSNTTLSVRRLESREVNVRGSRNVGSTHRDVQ